MHPLGPRTKLTWPNDEDRGGTDTQQLAAASRSVERSLMAHLAAAWPDQVLCKENKRKAINEQHDRWMRQREAELRAQAQERVHTAANDEPQEQAEDDIDELDEMNEFLAEVGKAVESIPPPEPQACDRRQPIE